MAQHAVFGGKKETPQQEEETMKERLDWKKVSHEAIVAMRAVSDMVHNCGLESSLIQLIDIRVSQLNGCAWCLDMHTKDARALGETEQRIYAISAWEETPFFTQRERAALAWAEAVTLVHETKVPNSVYEQARQQFSEKELVNLTMAVNAINCWNRLNVAFKTVPGSYVSQVKRNNS